MSSYVDLDALLKRQGLVLLETVKDDYDHAVHVVQRDGRLLVLKVNAAPRLQRGLDREVSAALLLRVLGDTDPGWTVDTSAPIATGEGWLLREHVDRPALLEPDTAPGAVARAACALADLDRLAPDPATSEPAYRDPAGEPIAGRVDREREVDRWLAELDAAGALGALPPESLDGWLREARADVKPGFEIWDVELDDLLDLPDGRVGLYDLEWAHPFGRRYYDLAALFVILAVDLGRHWAAAGLLRGFLQRSRLPAAEVERGALPVVAEALLSRLYDAAGQQARQEAAVRARELLAGLLDAGLRALCAPERLPTAGAAGRD